MIENLPKGAIPDAPDPRDFAATPFLVNLPPPNWKIGSLLPRPPLRDQNTADDCVAHAWSYYHWEIKGMEFSRRDLFARIAQTYGAVIRDGGVAIVNQGQQTEMQLPDPNPETPENMRDKSGVTAAAEAAEEEGNSFVVPNDIDSTAQAIAAYKGVVFGVIGSNLGWADITNPRPPIAGETTWGHALYAVDFHIHSDGQKCIIAVTSWPSTGVTEHHIRENYFTSGNTFNPWTLIPKGQQSMDQKFIININGTEGVLVAGQFAVSGALAKDAQTLDNLKAAFGFTGSEPTVTFPQQ